MTLKLFSQGESGVIASNSDIAFDANGEIITIESDDELMQDANKCVVTASQQGGYGTNIRRLLGTRNQYLFKSLGIMSALASLQYLRKMYLGNSRINDQIRSFSVISIYMAQVDQTLQMKVDLATPQGNRVGLNVTI